MTEVDSVRPAAERIVYGPCPVCDAWQVDVPYGMDPAAVEAVLVQHDDDAHPGALRRFADAG